MTGHGIIFLGTVGTQLVLTTPGEYIEFEVFTKLMGKKKMMNLFAGYDCCRVVKTLKEMGVESTESPVFENDIGKTDVINKGQSNKPESEPIDKFANFSFQFGCVEDEVARINYKNELKCSNYT